MDTDLEETLRAMGTDYVDVFFLHKPPEDPDQIERAIEKMLAFKKAVSAPSPS